MHLTHQLNHLSQCTSFTPHTTLPETIPPGIPLHQLFASMHITYSRNTVVTPRMHDMDNAYSPRMHQICCNGLGYIYIMHKFSECILHELLSNFRLIYAICEVPI